MSVHREVPALNERVGSVLVISLNRPAVKNSVNAAMALAVSGMLDEFEKDDDLKVCVLTGSGGTFCAGMDLRAFQSGESPRVEPHGFLGLTQRYLSKPLIAAVEGAAVGGGFETALACDMIVCSESAYFGLSEVKRGLAATGGGLLRLPHRMSINLAMEMALTGDAFDSARAASVGLINRLVPDGRSLAGALALAQCVARNAPLAVAASKKIIVQQQDWSRENAEEKQAIIAAHLKSSRDALEGAHAFLEKRNPVWRGL